MSANTRGPSLIGRTSVTSAAGSNTPSSIQRRAVSKSRGVKLNAPIRIKFGGIVDPTSLPADGPALGSIQISSVQTIQGVQQVVPAVGTWTIDTADATTAIFNPLWQAVGHEQGKAFIGSRHPIGRMAEPEDLGELVLWLASDRSRFVTGAEFTADGGLTAGLLRRSLFAPS